MNVFVLVVINVHERERGKKREKVNAKRYILFEIDLNQNKYIFQQSEYNIFIIQIDVCMLCQRNKD